MASLDRFTFDFTRTSKIKSSMFSFIRSICSDDFQITKEDYYRKINKMVENMKDDDENEVSAFYPHESIID